MKLSDNVYNTLKWVVTLLLPALGTLYFALSRIWALPYAEEVVGTITAVVTFLGCVLGISSKGYGGSGEVNVKTAIDGSKDVTFKMTASPDDISKQKKILLTVTKD